MGSKSGVQRMVPKILRASLFVVCFALLSACGSMFAEPDIPFEEIPPRPASTPAVTPSTSGGGTAELPVVSNPTVNYDNPNAYVLGNGDTISILVFDESDLTMDAAVGDSGEINYSYLGAITVAGKTPVQIEREITSLLKDGYLVNPSVNVTIKEYRPFFMNGEVRNPGGYPYQPGLTLEKAIALAGGLTDRASQRRMYVIRAGNEEDGKRRIKLSSPVAPGDVIEINEGFL